MITFEALEVILRVQNLPAFSRGMREGANSVRAVGRAARSESASTSAAVYNAARKATLGITMLGAAAAVAGYNQSVAFDREMTLIQTQAGRTHGEVAALTPAVLDLAKETGQVPIELSKGLFGLASTGLPTVELMKDLKVAADGAAVGMASVDDTTNALTGAWLANIEGAGDMEQTMGILNATVGAGNMRMQDLVTAMGTGVLPAAKNFGLSIQDVMGALALLTDEGYGAYGAMAQFATALHFIGAPTEKARKAMKAMGLDALEIGTVMRDQGMVPALRLLKETIENFSSDPEVQTDMLAKILPGGRGRVIVTLMNQLDRYDQKLHQINNTSDDFAKSVERTHETSAWKLKQAWASLQVDLIKLGDSFRDEATPVVIFAIHALGGVIKGLWWMIKHLPILTAIFGPFIATWVAYRAILVTTMAINAVAAIWGLVAAFVAAGSAIGFAAAAMMVLDIALAPLSLTALVIAGIIGIVVAIGILVWKWSWLRHAAVDTWHWIKQAGIDTWNWIKRGPGNSQFFHLMMAYWKMWARVAVAVFNWVKNAAIDTFNWIKNQKSIQITIAAVRLFGHIAIRVAHRILKAFKDTFNWIKNNANQIKDIALKYTPLGLVNRAAGFVGLPHGASGFTNFAGGMAVVGERGPELAYLPRGSNVIPNQYAFSAQTMNVPHSTQPSNAPSTVGATRERDREPFVVQLDGKPIYKGVAKRAANKRARR